MQKNDLIGRILGALIFLAGIVLLCYVFMDARALFASSDLGLQWVPPKGSPPGTATNMLGESAVKLFARIGLLFLMSIVGSMVASRGVHLYYAASSAKSKTELIE